MLGKIEGRRRGQQRIRRFDGIINSMDMSLSKLQEMVKNREACMLQSTGSQRVRHDIMTEQQLPGYFLTQWLTLFSILFKKLLRQP